MTMLMAAFGAETAMAAPVERWLCERGSTCIGSEVEAGFGVPDLMAGIGEASRLRNRRRQAPPVVDSLQLRLLQFCACWRTEEEVREWAPNGYDGLRRRALEPLVQAELLLVDEGRMRARRQPKDPFDEVIAVELKLHDAGRGLRQAHGYRAFADKSYLALPASAVTSGTLDRARRHSVGLLAVHPGAVEEVVEPPRTSVASPGRRRLAAERMMAASRDPLRRAGSPRR